MSEATRTLPKMIIYGLVALVLWALTALFVWTVFGNIYYGWVSQKWPVAEATVLRSEVEEILHEQPGDDPNTTVNARGPRSYTRYRPVVEYQWRVEGQTYTRARRTYSAALANEETRAAAEAILAPYPVGAKVEVYYDPGKHSRAILEPGPHWGGLNVVMIAALVTAAFAATFTYAAWRGL